VRNVKWLTGITLSEEEAHGPWQRGMSYKGFGPSTKTIEGIDVENIPSLQEQPVQSAIMVPKNGSVLHPGPTMINGYAYSGGGRGIVRVDVSSDAGKTWKTATLTAGKEQPLDRAWAWTFWESVVDIPEVIPSDSSIQVGDKSIKSLH
jgi:sulfite oxidase